MSKHIRFSEKDLRKIKNALYYFSVVTEGRIDEFDEAAGLRSDTKKLEMLADKYRDIAENIPRSGSYILTKADL